MRHRLLSLLAVTLTVGCGDSLAPDSIDAPAFAVTGTFPGSDCQFSQKGMKVKLLNDCTATNSPGIELAPGTKFNGANHTITYMPPPGPNRAIEGVGGSFEVKGVTIVATGPCGRGISLGDPGGKIKVNDVRVSGCFLGIRITNATQGSVSGSHIEQVFVGLSVVESDNMVVDDNEFVARITGIVLGSTQLSEVKDNTISANLGILLNRFTLVGRDGRDGRDNVVEDNTISAGNIGILLDNRPTPVGPDVLDNVVKDNTISAAATPCEDRNPGANEWNDNENLTGNPSNPPELCPIDDDDDGNDG